MTVPTSFSPFRLITNCLFLILIASQAAQAEEARVAVAVYFRKPMEEIAKVFQAKTSHTLRISSGSSGQFYAQFKNGAPLDVFFSADQERPQWLEQEGFAV